MNIGRLSFLTKAAAKEFFRNLRDRYKDFEPVADKDREHLLALIAIHPEAEQKIGAGIQGFHVAQNPEWPQTRCFFIDRVDGTRTGFSFLVCIDGAKDRKDVHQALRTAVKDQTIRFKFQALSKACICPISGCVLTEANSHVDHAFPKTFDWLVKQWMEDAMLEYRDLILTPSADMKFSNTLADDKIRECWVEYHRENAVLRLVSIEANLSILRRGR